MASAVKCSLCGECDIYENRIIKCAECGLNVHTFCYGIKNAVNNDGDVSQSWKCSPCQRGISATIICELCQQAGGAFKQSACDKWVHLICALFTDGVEFGNAIEMEPIHLSPIWNTIRPQRMCAFCLKTLGFCRLCSKSTCKNSVHITCAQFNDCLHVITNETNDTVTYRAFCMDHKPSDSLNRLSSRSIQSILIKKLKKNRENSDGAETSARENAAFENEPGESSENKSNKMRRSQMILQKLRKSHMIDNASTPYGKPSSLGRSSFAGRLSSVGRSSLASRLSSMGRPSFAGRLSSAGRPSSALKSFPEHGDFDGKSNAVN